MKHNLFKNLTIYLLVIFLPRTIYSSMQFQLKGSIEAPISIGEVPEFVIRFQGKQTINKNDGIFSFVLNKKDNNNITTLLICEEILEAKKKKRENKRSQNTIKNFLVNTSKPYKFYELNNEYFVWIKKDLNEVNKEKHLAKIPQNTIIVLADPDIVERVETWPVSISSKYISGPKIILSNVSSNDLIKASEASLARSIDFACYFEKNQTKTLPSNTKSKVSIPDVA